MWPLFLKLLGTFRGITLLLIPQIDHSVLINQVEIGVCRSQCGDKTTDRFMDVIVGYTFYNSLFCQYCWSFIVTQIASTYIWSWPASDWTQWPQGSQWWSRLDAESSWHTHIYCAHPLCSHSCEAHWDAVTTVTQNPYLITWVSPRLCSE